MTQAGTRRFDLTALKSRSFFAYGLFFATSAPLDFDVPLAGDHALEDLPEGRVVDHPLHATALRERDQLVLDVLLQLRVCEFDSPETLPRLRCQNLTKDLLPLGLLLIAVLLLGLGLHLGLLELRHLPPSDRVELVLVHRHRLHGPPAYFVSSGFVFASSIRMSWERESRSLRPAALIERPFFSVFVRRPIASSCCIASRAIDRAQRRG